MIQVEHWRDDCGRLAIREGEIQVWIARLSEYAPAVFMDLLDDEERLRAARMQDSRLAGYFIVSRGILRRLLGAYLDENPKEIIFYYGTHGKPAISFRPTTPIDFNLSHSNGLAVFGFARGRQIGIDIEQVRPLQDVDGMAGMTFSPEECFELKSMTGAEKQALFYRMWTSREAVLKMTGSGWTRPLRSENFNFQFPDAAPKDYIFPDGSSCRLHTFHAAPGFSAALAERPHPAYTEINWFDPVQKDVV